MADNRDNPSNKIRRVSASSKNGQSSSRTNASKVQRSSSRGKSSGGKIFTGINTNVEEVQIVLVQIQVEDLLVGKIGISKNLL